MCILGVQRSWCSDLTLRMGQHEVADAGDATNVSYATGGIELMSGYLSAVSVAYV